MEELKTIGTYQEFKKALDTELYNQAEGFVRTGYLLKVARDTDILRESGYATVAEFAHAEYGLTKDVVSRYIAINDRYSEGGYSDRLQEQYQGYGVAKLQDMLTLPDAIIEVMSPEMTRKDIQEVKREYKEEEANPMASLMETPKTEQAEMTTLQQAMHQYLHDNREEFTRGFDVAMRAETEKEEAVNGILDAFAPSGVGIKTARIQGVGRVMISFRGKDAEVEVLNVRTQERQSYSWQQLIDELREVFSVDVEESGAEAWERIYEEEYEEKKEEVAPVQPSEEIAEPAAVVEKDEEDSEDEDEEDSEDEDEEDEEKESAEVIAEPQTLHDIQPDIPEPSPEENTEEKEETEKNAVELDEEEQQIPGQVELEDYEGVVPEAQYEEVTEDAGTDINTIAGMSEGSGTAGDALESGTDAGASGETEDTNTICKYDESTGAAESGGCETDPCTVEEDIWMEVRAAHQSITQYLTVWSDKESLMETDVMESIRLKAIGLAAGIEKIMILRAQENE